MRGKVIIINNLDKYQHYKDRHIIWIKLYVDTLQDYKFQQLEDDERWVFVGLILLAVKNDNKVPYDIHFITDNICFRKKNNLKRIKKFRKTIKKLERLNLIFIKPLPECYQDDSPDKKREEKKREDIITFSSNKELFKKILADYKEGKREYKPYFWGDEMRWKEGERKWYVVKNKEWLDFVDSEEKIEWK